MQSNADLVASVAAAWHDPSAAFGTFAGHGMALLLAYLLALPVGWNREQAERSAGLRTFPLVAIAACGFVLIGTAVAGNGAAQARVIQGLLMGVGFVGGGAIIKGAHHTHGTATAASLWATGALGAAVGYGLFGIAILLSLATFATLRFTTPFKEGEGSKES
ncbi:MAG TPA: MgtC/SapB family protein [Acidisoma sp.]|jgi:putative Mg2+ transporter-C (MgtC) family protein|uniref:MgtC/SapB family protein n=1 Tax=Acidisoma sp. TaxID=1872115 RepID=UPI002CFFBAFB|nr:MgtC/SapB family protein [Acidisoma sp.]HTI01664.1 MgtC/SapB family protein [Acidisoma sp.]